MGSNNFKFWGDFSDRVMPKIQGEFVKILEDEHKRTFDYLLDTFATESEKYAYLRGIEEAKKLLAGGEPIDLEKLFAEKLFKKS